MPEELKAPFPTVRRHMSTKPPLHDFLRVLRPIQPGWQKCPKCGKVYLYTSELAPRCPHCGAKP